MTDVGHPTSDGGVITFTRRSMRADAMDGLDQQVDQPIGERPAAQMRECRKGRQPKWLGMPAQLVWGLDGNPLAVALDLVRPCMSKKTWWQAELANQVELGQLGLQAVDARPARIGPQLHQHRGNRAVAIVVRRNLLLCRCRPEKGVQAGACGRRQPAMDFATKPLVIGVHRGTNDALDAIGSGRLDLEDATALFEGARQLDHIATVGHSMITQPFRQHFAIGNGRLAESDQLPDFNAVTNERAFTNVEHARRLCRNAKLLGNRRDGRRIDLGWVARKATVEPEEKKQRREGHSAFDRLGPDQGAVGNAQDPGIVAGLCRQGLDVPLQSTGTHVRPRKTCKFCRDFSIPANTGTFSLAKVTLERPVLRNSFRRGFHSS